MNAENHILQAMVVSNGRIQAIGTNQEINAAINPATRVIDLKGLSVVPGFIDAHSHFPASGIRQVSVDLSPPPIGTTRTLEQLLSKVKRAASEQSREQWILGYNYDNTSLKAGAHPTREQLDAIVPDQPVYLWHSSGHMGVANSRALEALSIDENSVAPDGGVYGYDLRTGKLNGLLQEKAAPSLSRIIKQYSFKQQLQILTYAREEYLAAGITTVQNGYAGRAQIGLLRAAQWLGLLNQRVVVWPSHEKQAVTTEPPTSLGRNSMFHVGAVKILVDGSPQGMTAFLSEPYYSTRLTNEFATNAYPDDYRGYAHLTQTKLNAVVSDYHRRGHQLALHGNGDEAIEQILMAVELAQLKFPRPDARHILVHAQTIREDQIARLKRLSVTPSFFNSHTYYWGDWHRQRTLGPERAANISPAKWAQQGNLRFTLHADTPVTPIDPMQLLWSATKRLTQSGVVLGGHQRIDISSALRAITIDAAWQNHLDKNLGSLEVGKFADFVVLSDNPVTADDERQINVLATYIGGAKRYERKSTQSSTVAR